MDLPDLTPLSGVFHKYGAVSVRPLTRSRMRDHPPGEGRNHQEKQPSPSGTLWEREDPPRRVGEGVVAATIRHRNSGISGLSDGSGHGKASCPPNPGPCLADDCLYASRQSRSRVVILNLFFCGCKSSGSEKRRRSGNCGSRPAAPGDARVPLALRIPTGCKAPLPPSHAAHRPRSGVPILGQLMQGLAEAGHRKALDRWSAQARLLP